MSQVVGLPNNSYKPITNTAWVRARICKLQKGCIRLAAASDKVYQLLAHGRWFSPPSSTTKTGCHDIAESGIKTPKIKSNHILVIVIFIGSLKCDPIQEFFRVSDCCLIFQLYHDENKLIFNEMMMRSTLYQINTLSWIFIVLAHGNNSSRVDIILIPSQPVFALSP